MFSESPQFYNFIQKLLVGNIEEKMLDHIPIMTDEKIVEICCGPGRIASIIKNHYLGVDINISYVMQANKTFVNGQRKFAVMDACNLAIKEKSFEVGLLVCCGHHFSDSDLISVVKCLCEVVTNRIIYIDIVPNNNLLAKFLYKLDAGKYIRSQEEIEILLKTKLHVKQQRNFVSATGLYRYCALICEKA